jgi:acyl-CoA reductase-like NAD-dependent aldehyde dehydrogenase
VPEGLSTLLIGGRAIGEVLVDHPRVPLVSATGSTRMGRTVAPRLAARFARSILELGGNNAAIISPTADMDLALRGIAFSAMGTAGQRCTTLRPLVEVASQDDVVRRETFAPILYVMKYEQLADAVHLNNDVPQGLSSCIFTNDLREAEYFISALGSDCGIANVNIGPSGAEIGGAFGGEKETGGGREAGSDCWKGYMRRATNTINYGSRLPLAQGVKFDI